MSLKEQARNLLADQLMIEGRKQEYIDEIRSGTMSTAGAQEGYDITIRALMRALNTAPEGKVLINANAVVPCSCGANCDRVDCRVCGTTLS